MSDYEKFRRIYSEVRPHIVFHLAGHVQGSRNLDQVRPTLVGNLLTTVNLLVIAADMGCERIVLTGSQDEPDPGESDATAFVPSSPYAASKYAGNAYARMFRALYQSPVTIGRIFMAYGPGQRDIKKLIPYTVLCVRRGQTPKMSSGSRPLDWIYVDDVLDGLITISQSPNADGQIVHLGTGVTHTARQAVERIIALMESSITPVFGALQDRQLEKARFADVSATQAKVGWQPTVTFDEGLLRTIAWYQEQLIQGTIPSE
jgi:nucleoside-diphosphate-sugar epimerase